MRDGGEEFLDALQRTILCLCLDDTSPSTKEQCSRTLWHGDGKNRFFDKSVQFVVCENGVSGMIGEHSMMDGAATLNMVNWVFDYLTEHESSMFDSVSVRDMCARDVLERVLIRASACRCLRATDGG